MEPIELRRRARRAYDWARARLGAKAAGAALLIAAPAVGLGVLGDLRASLLRAGHPHLARSRLAAVRRVARVDRARPGTFAIAAAARGYDGGCSMFGPACIRFCLPTCVVAGGAIAPSWRCWRAARENGALEFLAAGASVAALTARWDARSPERPAWRAWPQDHPRRNPVWLAARAAR